MGQSISMPVLISPTGVQAVHPDGEVAAARWAEWMQTPPPAWQDIAWLREQWGGPFLLKGVMRVDDAKRAVDAGVTAISVSTTEATTLTAPLRRCGRCRNSARRT